jgi:hypothetical protein
MTTALTAKIATLTTAQIGEIAAAMFTDARAEATDVLDACLGELQRRLTEADFVALCDRIEGSR